MFEITPIDTGLELRNETVGVTLTNIQDDGKNRWVNIEVFEKETGTAIISERRLDLLDARAQSQLLASLTLAVKEINWDKVLPEITDAVKRAISDGGLSKSIAPPAWEPPLSFHNHINVPPFPSEVLPPTLQAYARGLAEATQTPIDLPALLSLAVCATAIARKVKICIRPGYTEPTNIFIVVVLPPGSRKSVVFAAVSDPLQAFEQAENERLAPEIAAAESEFRVAEKVLAQAEAQAAKEADSLKRKLRTQEAGDLAKNLATMKRRYSPRLVADDITPERIGSLLYEQEGRMSVMSPEGGDVFDMMAGRYAGNRRPSFGVFLKGHAGDVLRVDRVGRSAEHVEQPALTLALTAQPEAIRGLITQPGFQGRGLLGRFLYSIPNSRMGSRKIAPASLSAHTKTAYYKLVTALMQVTYRQDEMGELSPHILNLTSDARDSIDAFDTRIEPQLGPFGAMAHMTDWAGKLVGAAARLAAVLHMAKHAEDAPPWDIPISKATMDAAIRLADYLIPHAKAAYGQMEGDPLLADAKFLLDWIQSEARDSFSKRDAHRGTEGHFRKVADLEPALKLLIDHEYIRPQSEPQRPGPGRKPSPTFILNPLADRIDTIDTIPPEGEETPYSVDCVDSVVKDPENFSTSDEAEIDETFE